MDGTEGTTEIAAEKGRRKKPTLSVRCASASAAWAQDGKGGLQGTAPAFRLGSCGGRRLLLKLTLHLLHHLPHGCDMARGAALAPGLVALRGLFQVSEKLWICEALASLGDDRLDAFPDAEKLTAGFEEEVFVKQIVVQERAGLIPVTEDHHRQRTIFRAGRRDAIGILESFDEVIPEEPIACLA